MTNRLEQQIEAGIAETQLRRDPYWRVVIATAERMAARMGGRFVIDERKARDILSARNLT
jgi:hypothetical protein